MKHFNMQILNTAVNNPVFFAQIGCIILHNVEY